MAQLPLEVLYRFRDDKSDAHANLAVLELADHLSRTVSIAEAYVSGRQTYWKGLGKAGHLQSHGEMCR